jgi:hypothetical protein
MEAHKLGWQQFFGEHILDRGYDYFCDGAVGDLKKVGDLLTAAVEGTSDYFVEISFSGELITDMSCSCPYAEDGNYCKHMAAVLFKHEEFFDSPKSNGSSKIGNTNVSANKTTGALSEVIAGMGTETLRKELLTILENDKDLRIGFMLRYYKSDDSMSEYYNNKLKNADMILRQCSDHHGFVDWRNASSFASRLISEVIFDLRDFTLDDDEAKKAFDVSIYVFCLFADTDIDDSGGETQYFTDECIELWDSIVENSESRDLLEYIFKKLTQTCEKIGFGEYMSDEIDAFISEHFKDNDFTLSKLESIDRRIERLANDKSWHGDYELSKNIKERMKLMEEFGHSKGDVEKFRKQYWHLPTIRGIVMSELEDAGNLPDLIQLLEKSKEMDSEFPGLVSKYSRKLIDCYLKGGWPAKAREERFEYITEYNRGNIDVFYELKQNTAADLWHQERKKIFDALSAQGVDIKHLLASEGLKDQLFDALAVRIREGRGFEKLTLSELIKYEDALRPEYDNELLDLYERLIWKLSEFAGGRSYYQEIAGFIKKMFSFAEGKFRVSKMLESWRFTYSNRPAMQDELKVLYRYL